ncbi:MAG: hypothetical protein A2087_13385 [Spirochaetes bacterium GWD1_61_31]|nr:MAG: hypothetical protein A2Y37_02790 [Spirochaetes bacterium GWB1_60_80]OHD31297.1 MAG: hypothetical protein A2004_13665 [Spirochaetes bacterium GWC1_61_12]OHD39483.1 MAG: hypothetical protein A2087_13385 [Spirochaetes bacterium GWD1_61_31]OHD45535.1 MAG: hypothetical protein A2Y35_03060 [Spirochaetes bacterium GWE1_60_18]OHD58108.1 MAG: hypothetical protein A2Y32_05635 [Spirochaetes bacterium GWF1_60_12]HAP44680.1 hypothetical protein [Spirochaetaceae bacterium]
MITGAKGRRRIPEIAIVAIIYSISLLAAFLLVRQALQDATGLPDFNRGMTASLLLLLPLALLGIFVTSLLRFFRQLAQGVWGSRLRLKLVVLFLAAIMLAAAPAVLFMSLLTLRAIELPATRTMRDALSAGFELALHYYQTRELTLRNIAETRLPESYARIGANPAALLADLQRFDPAIEALELRIRHRVLDFSGVQAAQTPETPLPGGEAAFLPRLASNDASWARYFIRNIGLTADGQPVSAIVALRYPGELDGGAEQLTAARTGLTTYDGRDQPFALYLVFFVSIVIVPLLTLAMLFALAASDMLLRPISALEGAFRRVKSGQGHSKLLTNQVDESGRLIDEFNSMLDQLDRHRDDELRNEKIGVWRDIARRLAHELRNPLTPIKLSAERVLRRYRNDPATVGDILEKSMIAIVQETSNMENLLSDFQAFARLPEAQKNWLRLADLVGETVLLYSASLPNMQFITSGIPDSIVLKADRGYLKQALSNLITNAADACDSQGRVEIRADLVKTAESRYCRIQLRDNGRGIPPELQDKVFSPYYTTKQQGTGLGLAVVEHVINSHGGSIRLESAIGQGTVFYIDLPIDEAPLPPPPEIGLGSASLPNQPPAGTVTGLPA